jgi:hypothetical protein
MRARSYAQPLEWQRTLNLAARLAESAWLKDRSYR